MCIMSWWSPISIYNPIFFLNFWKKEMGIPEIFHIISLPWSSVVLFYIFSLSNVAIEIHVYIHANTWADDFIIWELNLLRKSKTRTPMVSTAKRRNSKRNNSSFSIVGICSAKNHNHKHRPKSRALSVVKDFAIFSSSKVIKAF